MKISFSKQTKERTFKQLYEEYYAPFCLYAKRFVDDKETREDIVSDVLLHYGISLKLNPLTCNRTRHWDTSRCV